jgi:hypothetical protein
VFEQKHKRNDDLHAWLGGITKGTGVAPIAVEEDVGAAITHREAFSSRRKREVREGLGESIMRQKKLRIENRTRHSQGMKDMTTEERDQ